MDRDQRPLVETQPIMIVDREVRQSVPARRRESTRLHLTTTTVAVWLGFVVLLVGFLLLGSLTVHLEGGFDREMRIADVWVEMADELPDVSHPIFLQALYVLAIAVTLGGSFLALLIALAARDSTADEPASPSAADDAPTASDEPGNGD